MAQDGKQGREVGLVLLDALERARSRLAVAMAAGMKAAPAECRRHYQETDERMRRCLRASSHASRRVSSADDAYSHSSQVGRRAFSLSQ